MPSEKPVAISLTSDTFLDVPSLVNIWVARMTCELPDIVLICQRGTRRLVLPLVLRDRALPHTA